jgi:hypothetical protein
MLALGTRELSLRLALLLVALLALSTFSSLVRGPDRGIIDLHPLKPDLWLKARLPRLALDRLSWLASALILLLPLYQSPEALAAAAVLLGGAWFSGIGLGTGINLSASSIAFSPGWAPVLDAIRGANPRSQAAFLYAPGTALALAGLCLIGAALGLEAGLSGKTEGFLLLGLPFLSGLAGLRLAWRGRASLTLTATTLSEVDAAWAEAEDPKEARAVYLEWTVRLFPPSVARYLLLDLRNGWRAGRLWISLGFGLGALSTINAWGSGSAASLVASVSAAVIGLIGCVIEANNPSLPLLQPASARLGARAIAVFFWLQPPLLGAALSLTLRQGLGVALGTLALLELRGILLAILSGALAIWLSTKGNLLYLPISLIIALWSLS